MENQQPQVHANNIDVLGEKEEKNQEDAVMVDLEQSKDNNNGGHHTLAKELQRTRSHSSSSSDEEVEEGGERKRKKKKKGLIENIKEKLSGEKEGEAKHDMQDTTPQNINQVDNDEAALGKVEVATHEEDKKGFLDKLIEKLPGHHNTEAATQMTANPDDNEHNNTTHPEKKGLLEKIKESLPGHHENSEDHDIIRKEKLN